VKHGFFGLAWYPLVAAAVATLAFGDPSIEDIALHPTVQQYGRQEIAFQIRGVEAANPYDPAKIAVHGVFVSPSGREIVMPGFFYVAHEPVTNSPAKASDWRVRFAPTEVGSYLAAIEVSTGGGEGRRLATVSFRCTPSQERADFVRRTGRLLRSGKNGVFLPMGANRCWSATGGAAGYLEDMRRQADNGLNCVRVWLAPWWLPIETRPGVYDPAASALLDAIVARAEDLGMRVIVCIEQHGNLQPEGVGVGLWSGHPYNAANGGPCRRRLDFFTSPRAKALFKNRLRYLVARWGYSPSVLAWELFNEVEWAELEYGGYVENRLTVARWHREMSEYLRERDPFGHLVFTSGDVALQKELLERGAVDAVTIHMYKDKDLGSRLREVLVELRGKVEAPILIEEFGHIRDGDPPRRLTRGLFIAALGGMGAGALPWLQDVREPGGFYECMSSARRFFEGVGWAYEDFRPFERQVVVEFDLARYGASGRRESLPEPMHVLALRGKTRILMFAFNGPETGQAPLPQWVRFRLRGVPVGRYHVEVWNAAFGNVIRQIATDAEADGLLVEVPECPAEVALKIDMPLEAAE